MAARTTHITLLKRLSAGDDRTAWRDFVDRYGDLIRGFARRAGRSDNDADDVLQDVLVALVAVMPNFQYDPSKGRFRGYLKTIVLRSLSKKRRQNDAARSLEEGDDPVGDDESESNWELEWRQYHLRRAMSMIETEFSVQDRAAFQRYAVEGHAADETARTLGISVDQVYQAKSRILKRLGTIVAEQVDEEG